LEVGILVAKQVAAEFGSGTQVKYFKNFGTAMIRKNEWIVEFVGARKESYRKDSRKPLVEKWFFYQMIKIEEILL